MRNLQLDIFQSIIVLAIVLWLIALGFSIMVNQWRQYLQWTGRTIRLIWRNYWLLFVGIALGYYFAGKSFLNIWQ